MKGLRIFTRAVYLQYVVGAGHVSPSFTVHTGLK